MCISANKHVHALKSWMEVPNGWNFTDITQSAQNLRGLFKIFDDKQQNLITKVN